MKQRKEDRDDMLRVPTDHDLARLSPCRNLHQLILGALAANLAAESRHQDQGQDYDDDDVALLTSPFSSTTLSVGQVDGSDGRLNGSAARVRVVRHLLAPSPGREEEPTRRNWH